MNRENRQRSRADVEDQDEGGYDDQWPDRLCDLTVSLSLPVTHMLSINWL